MAINYFIGKSQEWLETELSAAQRDLSAGKATIKAGSGDIYIMSAVEKSIEMRIKLLLQALNRIDPETYPIADITAASTVKIAFGSPSS